MHPHTHPGRAALVAGIPAAIVVVLHCAISTAIILVVDPDVRDPVAYWLVSVLAPSLGWAVLVMARAALWRRRSAFWLGASAGIVVLLAFLTAFWLVVMGIPVPLRGAPLALIFSSWILLGCAVAVALALRIIVGEADEPTDVELDLDVDLEASADPHGAADARLDPV